MEPGLTGVQLDTSVFRPATGVQDSVNSLGLALLISLLIAVGLFWLLFRSWRVAVIALVAIATTVIDGGRGALSRKTPLSTSLSWSAFSLACP